MIHTMAKIIDNLTEEQDALRSEIIAALHESVCSVTFIKSDGTERVMQCTLLPERLPIRDDANTGKPKPKRTPMNVVVWDIEKSDWRSFNIKNVIRWKRER